MTSGLLQANAYTLCHSLQRHSFVVGPPFLGKGFERDWVFGLQGCMIGVVRVRAAGLG
jgi:hypothetical protein